MAKGLVDLHRLIADGKEDSPEAESIRDVLDGPLSALNETEKERAKWLSEDLYSISESGASPAPNPMGPEAQYDFNAAIEARLCEDWDRALALVRPWKQHIAPALLSYSRGRTWDDAGYPAVATAFFRHASECEPASQNYKAHYLVAVSESDPKVARELAAQVLAGPEGSSPWVVVEAANIRFSETKAMSDAESARVYRELIPILEKNLVRIEGGRSDQIVPPEYEMTVSKLGMCYELLGDSPAAVDAFSRGLAANPANHAFLVARGILLYGASPRAITDFEEAVRLKSGVIWPYLFLAHAYLASGRFEECRFMCETGLRMRGSDAMRSQLEEWRGIAQAALGFPADAIRGAFEAALRLDPSSESARRNQHAFDLSLIGAPAPGQKWWAQPSPAVVRQLSLAERRYRSAA